MSPFDYNLLSIFIPSLVHCWLLFYLHIWSLAWFLSQASWNCWNLLSFIGVETSHQLGPEKRSVIDVVKNIIDSVITGLNFLHLWGEERALRLRTGATGPWFNQNSFCETSVRIHEYGHSGSIWAVTYDGDVRVLCSLGHGGSPHLHFHLPPYISLPSLCQDLSFITMWDPSVSGLPEFGHQIYWVK